MIAGIANALQPRPNATMAKGLTQPFAAGLVIIVIRSTLLIFGLVSGRVLPTYEQAAEAP